MEGRGLICMGDKGWRFKYRGWTTADEIWTMESGGYRMLEGGLVIEDGLWTMAYKGWKMDYGV